MARAARKQADDDDDDDDNHRYGYAVLIVVLKQKLVASQLDGVGLYPIWWKQIDMDFE